MCVTGLGCYQLLGVQEFAFPLDEMDPIVVSL